MIKREVLTDSSAGGTIMIPADEVIRANESVSSQDDVSVSPSDNCPINQGLEVHLVHRNIHPYGEVSGGATHPINLAPAKLSKITELTLDRFKNNYRLFVQKLADVETDLVIRAILLKKQ